MAQVLAQIKIMPEGVETDLAMLKNELIKNCPPGVQIGAVKIKPIAFGLRALLVNVILEDAEGGTESVEQAFARIKGVESVEVVGVTRI
ncbi:MAG: elongation factor 1-beta [Methanocellales archaeon]